ncbi:MAG: hypothetical protein HY248_01495 [Fimbriimonas ginsengisoli]|uniref:Uncharacterized protein n=1 Tax=Fimbriimonas ginsengisoli TaxID=1005039 RepID=A0A931LR65_FIMGI|nr:hypothetical protein [Fimbriimonas ginsengisoli]MBI3721200.1 hypothetical protein [Fimbriimonas ginsengisoli]
MKAITEERKEGSSILGLVAAFVAGVGVAASVAYVVNRAGSHAARRAESVFDACDRAVRTLETRLQSVDVALAG